MAQLGDEIMLHESAAPRLTSAAGSDTRENAASAIGSAGIDVAGRLSAVPDKATTARRRSMLLVGPGKHFGIELIARFQEENFEVGVIALHPGREEDLKREIQLEPIRFAAADIRQPEAFSRAIRSICRSLENVDCLIYNPKISITKPGLSTPPVELAEAMAVNVTGSLVAIQSALPFLKRSHNSSVILTGGNFKDKPDYERFALSVGKAGLHGVAKALRAPLKRQGILLKTLIINGSVRRAAEDGRSSSALAECFWSAFANPSASTSYFPSSHVDDQNQLSLF